ncbi:hypothetical protein ACFL1B_06290 [Nanoarchaeota archaeon]
MKRNRIAAVLLLILVLLAGCIDKRVDILEDGDTFMPGTLYKFDKARVDMNKNTVIEGDVVLFQRTVATELRGTDNIDVVKVYLADRSVKLIETPGKSEYPMLFGSHIAWWEPLPAGNIKLMDENGDVETLYHAIRLMRGVKAKADVMVWEQATDTSTNEIYAMRYSEPATVIAESRNFEEEQGNQSDGDNKGGNRAVSGPTTDGRYIAFFTSEHFDQETASTYKQITVYDLDTGENWTVHQEMPANSFDLVINDGYIYLFGQIHASKERNWDIMRVPITGGQLETVVNEEDSIFHFDVGNGIIFYVTKNAETEKDTMKYLDLNSGRNGKIMDASSSIIEVDADGRRATWTTWGGPEHYQVYLYEVPR